MRCGMSDAQDLETKFERKTPVPLMVRALLAIDLIVSEAAYWIVSVVALLAGSTLARVSVSTPFSSLALLWAASMSAASSQARCT